MTKISVKQIHEEFKEIYNEISDQSTIFESSRKVKCLYDLSINILQFLEEKFPNDLINEMPENEY